MIASLVAAVAAVALAGWFFWPRPNPTPGPMKPPSLAPQQQVDHVAAPPKEPPVLKAAADTEKPKTKPKVQDSKKPDAPPKTTQAAATLEPTKPSSAVEVAKAISTTGEVKVNPKDGLKYVWIGAGKFMMGCSSGDAECENDEIPAHEVTLTKGFWIGETEVTQAAYERVTGRNPSSSKGADLPVDSVSWFQAGSYCKEAGMRLPTEAEWEYAARGGRSGSRLGKLIDVAWWLGNSGNQTHQVAQKRPNVYGLYDMLGNVAEWTADWYGPYLAEAATDPHGSSDGEYRAVRGGSARAGPRVVRVSSRLTRKPIARGDYIGFRCAGE